MRNIVTLFITLICTSVSIDSFYLPGLAPVNYCKKEDNVVESCKSEVLLYVNRLNTEESVIPYEYNHFDFCVPDGDAKSPVENLGQVVFGERIRPSSYKIEFMKNLTCGVVCTKHYSGSSPTANALLSIIRKGISLNYQHHWIVDNMPVTNCYDTDEGRLYCSTGFPMGCFSRDGRDTCSQPDINRNAYYIYNHVDLIVTYHSGAKEEWGSGFGENGGRIISVKVKPRSINHRSGTPDCLLYGNKPLEIPSTPLEAHQQFNITYTYSITFKEDNSVQWSLRWDYLLDSVSMLQANIQWYSIANSFVILIVIFGILLRVLYRDNSKYNQLENGENIQEDFGWKLVHGDVFRCPRKGMLLSAILGSGVQVFFMVLITLLLACLGFLHPENSGALMTCAMITFVVFGTAAGYVAVRMYKSFGGEKWQANVLLTSMLCPGIVFCLFFITNLILWSEESSAVVPFTTLLELLALWFGVSVPLTFVGGYCGFRQKVFQHPVETNKVPRFIPEHSICTQLIPGVIMSSVLPFGCIFTQFFFILNSIWASQTYHMFGFLFVVFVLLILTCAATAILLCYSHLRAEDYHWWWRSYLTSGFTAVYMFLYCCSYFFTKLEIVDVASGFLYFIYTLIMVFLFSLLTGSIGFFACFWFIRKIYSVKTLMKCF